jgi:toxin CptA
MANSRTWSNASAPCRIELRGSRTVAAACVLLGVLAAVSLSLSEIPAWLAWPLGLASIVRGMQLAYRELAHPAMGLTLSSNAPAFVDGVPVQALRVRWRGPLAFVQWCDAGGRTHRRVATPDVLSPASRRELRLAWSAHDAARRRAAVAP